MSAGEFLTLFAGSGKRRLEGGWELRVVPAFAVLQARREALERSAQDDGALGLWMNACVLARALYKDGQRAFSDGEAVMQAASAEKIERWTQAYAALCREENPACSEENARLAVQALEQEDYERLKWRVLKRFGVLPSELRARRMTDREYLYCAAQMLLDEQEKLEAMCPACREKAKRRLCPVCGEPVPEENAGFDEGRFEELKNAGVCETASSDADKAGGAV